MSKFTATITHASAERIMDARTVAGSAVAGMGFGFSIADVQQWAAIAGFVVSVLTAIYMALGIYSRIRKIMQGIHDE